MCCYPSQLRLRVLRLCIRITTSQVLKHLDLRHSPCPDLSWQLPLVLSHLALFLPLLPLGTRIWQINCLKVKEVLTDLPPLCILPRLLPRRTISILWLLLDFSLTNRHNYRLLTYCISRSLLMFQTLIVPFCLLAAIYWFRPLLLKSRMSTLSKPALAVANNQRKASRWSQRRRWLPGSYSQTAFVHLLTTFFRNLFAIDYLKDHLDTIPAEFKVIYDGLAAGIKKVWYLLIPISFGILTLPKRYEELSKIKKAEEKNTRTKAQADIATST